MEGVGKYLDLQEKLLDTLLDVCEKRKEMPKKCANLVAQNLQLQQSLAKNSIVLSRTDVKRLASKYTSEKPMTTSLPGLRASMTDVSSVIHQVTEEQRDVDKIVRMCSKKSA